LFESDLNPKRRKRPAERDIDQDILVEEPLRIEVTKSPESTGLTYAKKNRLVDDMGKIVFDRRFKSFLNHKDEILRKNERKRETMRRRHQ
jgi:hypothetical protein